MKVIAFFNNKGGVGKTTLVNHIAWMLAEMGVNVVLCDLDPQANLTASLLTEEELEPLYLAEPPKTVYGAVKPLLDRLGDVAKPHVVEVHPRIALIAGDPALSDFEDRLSDAWTHCNDDNKANREDGLRVTSSLYRMAAQVASERSAEIVLLDLGPALSPLNRAALVASDAVVVPVGADLVSLRGLHNLGPRLREWRQGWRRRADGRQELPKGEMRPIGYVVLSHATRHNQPAIAFRKWVERIPEAFAREVMGDPSPEPRQAATDPNRLATMRNYMSLMPLAHEARQPIFALTARDGAIGAHAAAVDRAYDEFEALTRTIMAATGLVIP